MTTHSYSLRSRDSSSSLSNKTPTRSPVHKPARSPRKQPASNTSLQLRNVIGTTTSTPNGLSCCGTNNSYAYCAGSVAVLAAIGPANTISYRYFKARPTAVPVNKTTSYYDSLSAVNTPTRRRTILNANRGYNNQSPITLNRDGLDDCVGQTWSARERIKAVTCVSISPDGRILAVGETGYNPRVLLFSTSNDAPIDTPLSIITDHTIGVRCVAFSASSKYLATLGDVNDGFIYIWQVNTKTGSAKLHSSNKCTTNVCDMSWCGNNLITVGTRHIKVWHGVWNNNNSPFRKARIGQEGEMPSPGPAILHGRNCLLGPFVEATFTNVLAISQDQCVVCSDDGHLCLLDLSHGRIELSMIDKQEDPITAISCQRDPLRLVWAGGGAFFEQRDFDPTKTNHTPRQATCDHADVTRHKRLLRKSMLRQSIGLSPLKRAQTVALNCLNQNIISIDADGTIRVVKMDTDNTNSDLHRCSSHNGTVKGIQKLPKTLNIGSFLTWARDGEIRFWSQIGELLQTKMVDIDNIVEADDATMNELKVVRYVQNSRKLITGDQFGLIKIIDEEFWTCSQTIRAHSAEVNSIDVHELSSLMATCGRDRMVQIFRLRNSEAELLQTADDHIGVVNQVLFSHDSNRLLSCSADRTVVIRDRVERKENLATVSAFISTRTVTFKTAPLSMSFIPDQSNIFVVSTMDRQVMKVEAATGAVTHSFKVSDPESDDTVMLNSISLGGSRSPDGGILLAGYSSIDKSVRLYDLEKGILLGRDSGHTEGITAILMFRHDAEEDGEQNAQQTIVSTGIDGTIMIWSATRLSLPFLALQQEQSHIQPVTIDPEKTLTKIGPASLPPLRKILSRVDVAEFVRQHSPTRETSPLGLRKKTSRLALATSIEEADETSSKGTPKNISSETTPRPERRSPSPPVQATIKPKKQRSRSEMHKVQEPRVCEVLQSVTAPNRPLLDSSMSKHNTRANNGRLRRPPSVPTDLRTMAATRGVQLSAGGAGDFGSVGMATEQACRMLRVYSQKLQISKGDLNLDEIESDLEAVLEIVRRKKARANEVDPRSTARANGEYEIHELSTLLERTSVS